MRNPGLAAVLSVFMIGLGQIYNGEIGKGLAFMLVSVILVFIAVLSFGILFLLPIGFWIYNIYDAYNVAESMNPK